MKKNILIGMCILILFVTACKSQDISSTIDVDFRSGTQGLNLDFLDNLPPAETFEGALFVIAAKLTNEGAYEARNIDIQLIGFDPFFFEMNTKLSSLAKLQGKELTNPNGEWAILEFPGKNLRIPLSTTKFDFSFLTKVSYDYETIADLDMCVDTNIYSDLTVDQQSCEAKTSFSLTSQGAPIVVTKVEQTKIPSGDSATLIYTITVANKGKGKVVGPVRMKEARLANKRLVCRNREIDLNDKETEDDVFVCSTTEPININFLSKFSVSLFYRYNVEKKKQFAVKRFTK